MPESQAASGLAQFLDHLGELRLRDRLVDRGRPLPLVFRLPDHRSRGGHVEPAATEVRPHAPADHQEQHQQQNHRPRRPPRLLRLPLAPARPRAVPPRAAGSRGAAPVRGAGSGRRGGSSTGSASSTTGDRRGAAGTGTSRGFVIRSSSSITAAKSCGRSFGFSDRQRPSRSASAVRDLLPVLERRLRRAEQGEAARLAEAVDVGVGADARPAVLPSCSGAA